MNGKARSVLLIAAALSAVSHSPIGSIYPNIEPKVKNHNPDKLEAAERKRQRRMARNKRNMP